MQYKVYTIEYYFVLRYEMNDSLDQSVLYHVLSCRIESEATNLKVMISVYDHDHVIDDVIVMDCILVQYHCH
jgi:hypothetical protein